MSALASFYPNTHSFAASGARMVVSEDGLYRLLLTRRWALGRMVTFCMLNPSTATHIQIDRTVGRCLSFAKAWRFSALGVVNLFAYRSTQWKVLKTLSYSDAVGQYNDEMIYDTVGASDLVICAWGTQGVLHGRNDEVLQIIRLARKTPRCLKLTKDGHPYHPLYTEGNLRPMRLP
jgi:hypothetical protein